MSLAAGNHAVLDENRRKVAPTEIDNLYLAHFAWRSKKQIQSKVGSGWLSNVVKFTRHTVKAFHWYKAYDRMRRGKSPGIEGVTNGVMVKIPKIHLRYRHLVEERKMWNPYKMAEDLAEEVAELRFLLQAVPVMIIIPFTEDLAAFRVSMESVLKLDYVEKKIFICVRKDSYAGDFQLYLKKIAEKVSLAILLLDDGEDIDKVSFEENIQGDYIEILLPGVTLKENILRVMGAVLDKEPSYNFLLVNEILPDAYKEGTCRINGSRVELYGTILFTSLEKAGRFLEQDISAALFRKDFLLKGNLIGRILAAEGDRRVVWHDVLAAAGHFGFIEDTFLTREK